MINTAVDKLLNIVMGALDLFKFWVVLNQYEKGIILRLGNYNRTLGPGIHWRIPFRAEELEYENIRQQTTASWDMTFPLNGNSLTMSFAAMIEIADIKKVLLELNNWSNAAYTLIKIGVSESVNEVLNNNPSAYLDMSEFNRIVRQHIEKKLQKKGIKLVEFSFQEVAKTRAYKLFMGSK